MCKTPTGFLDSKCLLVAGLIILCNYCCEYFFKTVEQLKMEQCDKSKWRSLHFVVAMWLRFFSVKRSLALRISIKTTSVSKCQHPELKAITYAPFYKPQLYFLKCQIRFFCTWLDGRIWLYWFLFSFIPGTNFGRLELLIWKRMQTSTFHHFQAHLHHFWKDYKNLEIQVRKMNQY